MTLATKVSTGSTVSIGDFEPRSQAAVANVVRNDYNAQLATTAQFVAQYTAPVN